MLALSRTDRGLREQLLTTAEDGIASEGEVMRHPGFD